MTITKTEWLEPEAVGGDTAHSLSSLSRDGKCLHLGFSRKC